MTIDRRTFTFASLTLIAQGIPALASSKEEVLKKSLAVCQVAWHWSPNIPSVLRLQSGLNHLRTSA